MSHKSEGEGDKLELLVFGYACKLFRDDERAAFIDNGSHLIPWMGDDSLKIDRYDGRGTLHDLSQHEARTGAWDLLSPDEVEEERLCDRERYKSLYMEEETDVVAQEEILKRAQVNQEFSQVPYSYEEKTMSEIAEQAQLEDSSCNKPYVPPPELNIPQEMVVPETLKQHEIVERTACFIAKQGSQMEILMKVKQNSNKKFDFLSYNDPLHGYYKHILSLIKLGSYTPSSQDKSWSDDNGESGDDDHYLHPSLAAKSNIVVPSSTTLPAAPSQPAPPPAALNLNNPPLTVQKIVEKMVKYVVKNGISFESVILKRKEPRFSFLDPNDTHHKYYKEQLAKREECMQRTKLNKKETVPIVKEPLPPKAPSIEMRTKSVKKKPMPVCFSIKKPKESEGLEVSSALPVEESSEDDEEGSPKQPTNTSKPTSPSSDISDNSDMVYATPAKQQRRTSPSKNRQKHHKQQEKDPHLQKERKMKVAMFLKDLKSK